MALDPGTRKEQSIGQRELALAGDLFKETVKNRMIPPTITPEVVDEIGIPGHKVVVREVMKKFGRLGTFSTEYSGANLPDEDRARIASRYKRVVEWQRRSDVGAEGMKRGYPLKMDNLKIAPTRYSSRLHCLVIAHTPEWKPQDAAPVWNEDSQAVFFYLSDILGPTLGFNYDASTPNSPGDYNLLVAWAFKNVEKIKQLYLKKEDPTHIDVQLARGNAVGINGASLDRLNAELSNTVPFSPTETTPIEKVGLHIAELAAAPDTSTAHEFEKWFVRPQPKEGRDGIGPALDHETTIMFDDGATQRFYERLNLLSLLNMVILMDRGGSNQPLKRLDAKLELGGKLPDIMYEYLNLISRTQYQGSLHESMEEGFDFDREARTTLHSLRPEWGNQSLATVLNKLFAEMSQADTLGYGSGRAVLVQYNEEAQRHSPSVGRLLQYMGMMVKIASGDGILGVTRYFDEIKN